VTRKVTGTVVLPNMTSDVTEPRILSFSMLVAVVMELPFHSLSVGTGTPRASAAD
jgi:hypothetical protein